VRCVGLIAKTIAWKKMGVASCENRVPNKGFYPKESSGEKGGGLIDPWGGGKEKKGRQK